MSKILVVEDERKYLGLYQDIFDRLDVPESRVVFADNFQQALDWVVKNAAQLQVALVDLKIPREKHKGIELGQEGVEDAAPLGFELIRRLRQLNRDCEVVIISNFADEKPERRMLAKLRAEGVWVDAVLHKQFDLDMENNGGIELLRSYIEPVDREMAILERHGIYTRHPRLEKLVRKLKYIYREPIDTWPAPVLMFHGLPGSGKNIWARAAAILKAGAGEVPVFEQESLGALPSQTAGDQVPVRLFGAREFDRTSAAGLFEKASRYRGRAAGQLAREVDLPDFAKSGIAFLDELDSAPTGIVDSLLNLMSEGVIKTCGVKNIQVKIGCSVVFASLQGDELLNGGQSNSLERGKNALTAFFDRIPPNHIMEIPELKELGVDFALGLLKFRAGRDLPVQPAAQDLLVEGVTSGVLNVRELCQIKIPRHLRRLTFNEVQKVFGSGTRQKAVVEGTFSERQLADAREWLQALQSAVEQVTANGEKVNVKNLAKYLVSPRTRRILRPQRISQLFNSESFSEALVQLLRDAPEKNQAILKLIKD